MKRKPLPFLMTAVLLASPSAGQTLLEAPVSRGTYDTASAAFGVEGAGSAVLGLRPSQFRLRTV